MNENIDLTKILKDCPEGTQLYSTVYGDVKFGSFTGSKLYPILISIDNNRIGSFSADGKMYYDCGECALFPSKEQRDWAKFTAPWYKKDKFDPKTFKPFDKVLARNEHPGNWNCDIFSNINDDEPYKYNTISNYWKYCIPYNDETKHLVGTKDEAPEYYRYWED